MRTRPSLAVGTLACALTLLAPLTSTASSPTAPDPERPAPTAPGRAGPGAIADPTAPVLPRVGEGPRVPRRWLHSSDGVRGEIATRVPSYRRGPQRATVFRQWTAAPGVRVTKWDQATARGPVRLQLLSVDLRTRGLSVDHVDAGRVSTTAPLTKILARHRAVAGVNGDFFDIGDTGAPLGVGQDRQEGLRHAPLTGWNAAFFQTRDGRYAIDTLPLVARVKQRPRWTVTNVNSPEVAPGGIGAYTSAWGSTSGYRVTGGQTSQVRMIEIRRGRVVANRGRLTSGKRIRGTVLVGRGEGAQLMRKVRVGRKLTVSRWVEGRPRMAITGNKFLVRGGVVEVVDDREMHPRTAVGIDHETKQLLLLVVDGRQSFSRGFTMVELAHMMIDLGADEALNLDGGGSSTLVAAKPNGNVRVINQPSDGSQRSVPNGLEITYRPRR